MQHISYPNMKPTAKSKGHPTTSSSQQGVSTSTLLVLEMIPLPGPWGGIRNPSKNLRNFLPHNFLLMVFHRKIHTLELKSIQQKVPKKLVCLKMNDHENLGCVSNFVDDKTRSKVQIYSKPPRDILQEGAKPYDRQKKCL